MLEVERVLLSRMVDILGLFSDTSLQRELWVKGETSGHLQHVREIRVDCDADAILLKVEQVGGVACHEGYESCFFRRVGGDGSFQVVAERREAPTK